MADRPYTLAVYDSHGNERKDLDGDFGSDKALAQLQHDGITDVFLMCHGWEQDMQDAIGIYDAWTSRALFPCTDDIAKLGTIRPGFKPLLVGVHWPSKPWGDENVVQSFDVAGGAPAFDPVADYSERLGGTPEVNDAVKHVFSAIGDSANPTVMTPQVEKAYRNLDKALKLGADGPGGAPGSDRPPFDPQEVFAAARQAAGPTPSFSGFSIDNLLTPLRVLSFWFMRARARSFGESGAFNLLLKLQHSVDFDKVNFHLMGHSFGCIVVSAMMAGPRVSGPATSPVRSAVLVEGALSLWSYATEILNLPGVPGYFHPVIRGKKCTGPIVTTMTPFDLAVGVFYPLGAGLTLDNSFGVPVFPPFGGTGTFGIQGVDNIVGLDSMLAATAPYDFKPGFVYNVASANIIKAMQGFGGAHSDIFHPEVGHLTWQAAMAVGQAETVSAAG
jgi:hypothetical protein